MSDYEGPWGKASDHPPPPRPPTPNTRLALWLGLLAVLGIGLVALARAFPGAVNKPEDWAFIARTVGFAALVSTGLFTARRIDWTRTARHIAIWVGVVVALVLVVAYRDDLAGVFTRMRGELSPATPIAGAPRELVVTAAEDGGFYLVAQVNGQPVRFMIDTGASDIVLSPADARRIGVDTAHLTYGTPSETANGVGYAAAQTIDHIAVGPIAFDHMPVLVNREAMAQSLLGMSFLKRLKAFRAEGRHFYLTAAD
jgi:aspartyl protease family protein